MKNELKSKVYLKWISQFPCVICHVMSEYFDRKAACPQETVVPHHLPNSNHTRRHNDFNTIPVGSYHHRMLHDHPAKERAAADILKKLAERYAQEWGKL